MATRRGNKSINMGRDERGVRKRPGLQISYPVESFPEGVNSSLEFFLSDLGKRLKEKHNAESSTSFEVLGPQIEGEEAFEPLFTFVNEEKPMRKPVKIYDPEDMALKVVDRRLPVGYSHQHRLYWSKNDIGQIKGEIKNGLGREYNSSGVLPVTFSEVVRVSDIEGRDDERELALIPDAATEGAGILCRAHEISLNAFSKRLSKYQYPDAAFTPAMEFCRVRGQDPERMIAATVEIARQLLPITVNLGQIQFDANQTIRP